MRVEEIAEPLMQEIRYLDKLIDELAKGKAMDKILRDGSDAASTIEEYIFNDSLRKHSPILNK